MATRDSLDMAGDLLLILVSSLLLIGLGLVYFLVTMWIVSTASGMLALNAGGDFIVLTAGLLSGASILASQRS